MCCPALHSGNMNRGSALWMSMVGRTLRVPVAQPLNELRVGGSREIPMRHRNWCVFEKGHRYLDWFRVGLWCPTRAHANALLPAQVADHAGQHPGDTYTKPNDAAHNEPYHPGASPAPMPYDEALK